MNVNIYLFLSIKKFCQTTRPLCAEHKASAFHTLKRERDLNFHFPHPHNYIEKFVILHARLRFENILRRFLSSVLEAPVRSLFLFVHPLHANAHRPRGCARDKLFP